MPASNLPAAYRAIGDGAVLSPLAVPKLSTPHFINVARHFPRGQFGIRPSLTVASFDFFCPTIDCWTRDTNLVVVYTASVHSCTLNAVSSDRLPGALSVFVPSRRPSLLSPPPSILPASPRAPSISLTQIREPHSMCLFVFVLVTRPSFQYDLLRPSFVRPSGSFGVPISPIKISVGASGIRMYIHKTLTRSHPSFYRSAPLALHRFPKPCKREIARCSLRLLKARQLRADLQP